MSTELKVGAVVLSAVVVLGVFVLKIEDRTLFGTTTETYDVRVRFDTIAGLASDAPVHLAGVRVGRVRSITLTDEGQAEVLVGINSDVVLRQDATASVASLGVLGEKYLELTAGTPGSAVVTAGGLIRPGPAVSIDQMVAVMNGIAADVRETTTALSNVFGSEAGETRMAAILDNLLQVSRDVGEITQGNRDAIGAGMANFEEMTAAFDRSAVELEEIMQKINSGDGTAAQLINTSETIDKANAALETIDDSLAAFDTFFGRVGQTQLSFSLRSEWYGDDEATKNYFGFRVGLGASVDRAIIFELVNDNIGLPVVNTMVTETLDPAGDILGVLIQRVTSRDDRFKFSALLAARFNNWQFRGGLMESEAGVGIDYFAVSDKLRLRLEGWDFGRNPDPHIKFGGQFDVWDRVFITAGADDLLSSSFRQFFIGAGFGFR